MELIHLPWRQFPTPFCLFILCAALYQNCARMSHVIDCKTVPIFAYSSTREQWNKRSRLKTKSETGRVRLAQFARVRLLRHALPISLLILRKKPTVLQSTQVMTQIFRWNHHIIVRLPRRYLVAFSYPDYSKLNGNWHTCTNPRPGQYLTHEQSHITRVLEDICSYLSRPRGVLIRIFCKSCIIFFGSTSCI